MMRKRLYSSTAQDTPPAPSTTSILAISKASNQPGTAGVKRRPDAKPTTTSNKPLPLEPLVALPRPAAASAHTAPGHVSVPVSAVQAGDPSRAMRQTTLVFQSASDVLKKAEEGKDDVIAVEAPPPCDAPRTARTFSLLSCSTAVHGVASHSIGPLTASSLHIIQKPTLDLHGALPTEYQLLRVSGSQTATRQCYDVSDGVDGSDGARAVMLASILGSDHIHIRFQIADNIVNVFHKFAHDGKLTIRMRSPSIDLAVSQVCPRFIACHSDTHCSQVAPDRLQAFLKTLWEVYKTPNAVTGAPTKGAVELSTSQHDYSLQRRMKLGPDHSLPSSYPPGLESLHIEAQRLLRIPSAAMHLSKLAVLCLSHNLITSVPDHLGAAMPCLRVMSLSHNKLTSIPTGLCLPLLRDLDLSNNEISLLPPEFSAARSLERLVLNSNRILYD